ncbi:HvfC/BufC family peptide modification chaperone [Photobacterium sp. DNB22_13_2]
MHRPPNNMKALMQIFADGVRQISTPDVKSISQYHDLIKSNISSVISQTFPLFSKYASETELKVWCRDFLLNSHALEPEFHHIATEFVRFMQSGNHTLTPHLIALLEYEWVIFNAEINTEVVPVTKLAVSNITSETMLSNCDIEINPTLQLIEVPFLVANNDIKFINEHELLVAYAVYRNSSHQVLSQPLNMIDRLILAALCQHQRLSFDYLCSELSINISTEQIINWIQHFHQTELIRANATEK